MIKPTERKQDSLIISKVLERDKICVYCQERKAKAVDHIIPINKGGLDEPINMVGSCKTCNSSKNKLNVFKWCLAKRYKIHPIIIELLNKQLEYPKLKEIYKKFIRKDLEANKKYESILQKVKKS